jgi:hypothetical protein
MKRAILSALAVVAIPPALSAQEPVSYAKHVRPFLAKYCLECHNAKSAKAGLSLETVQAIREGSDGGSVLEPGKPDDSRIVLLVEGKDKPPMPPKDAKFHPRKEEIGVLRGWIASGAKDDSANVKVTLPGIKPRQEVRAPVTALAYNSAGKLLWTGTTSLDCYRVNEATAGPFRHIDGGNVTALALAKADEWLIAGITAPGQMGVAQLWHFPYGPITTKAFGVDHEDAILDVVIDPSATLLATCGYDTRIKLVEFATGRVMHTLKEHSDAVYAVAFSPDGRQLASCSADRAIKVFDVASGKLLYTLGEATDWLYTVAWSPDGKYLAAGGVDKSIRVYSPGPQGARLIHSVFAHQEPVQKILFSKDSKTLYSVGQGGALKSWDVERMVERKVYDRQPETVLCMALRPDGKQIALGRYDGIVVLIDEATGKVQAEIGTPQPEKKKQAAPEDKKKAVPQVKQVSPAAAIRGKTTALTLAGQGLDQLTAIETTIPGAKIALRPGGEQSRGLDIAIPATTTPGSYQLQLKTASGPPLTTALIVDAYKAIPEKDAGGSPATGQRVALPTTIVGSIDRAGDVDFFRFEAKQGQQLGAQIVTSAVGSKLEPVLSLLDMAGGVLVESSSGHLGYAFTNGGSYAIGVRDRDLRGGATMHYRLHLGEIPVVTSLVPLGLQRGTEADVRLEGVFLGTERVHVKAPADAAVGSKLPIPLTTPHGTPLGRLEVTVGEFPESTASSIAVPGTGNGVVESPGAAPTWSFHAKKGQRLIVEVAARRLGSDLDSFLEILDKDGQPVPRAVLRCVAKTIVTFRDHDSAGSGIRLDAWSELATNDYLFVGGELMKIQDLPPNPDADCTFFNTAGQRLGYLDTTPTHHALGTPMYKISMHPPGSTFPPNGFPVFTLYYRNDDGGPGYGRDSRIFFDPPADGEYRVRVRDARGLGGPAFAYRLTIRPPRPSFNVRFTPTAPSIFKGSSTTVTISADRLDGYDGPIAVRFTNLPTGLSAPPTVIEAGVFSTAVAMFAEPGAKLPDKAAAIKLIGEALIDGKQQIKETTGEAPKLLDPGDLVTVTEESAVTLRPGEQTKINVRIERRNGFTGRVPIEVRGLPHGVHALDIGLNGILINENETRRTVVLYAEPWVQALDHPFVVLARREGKNTEHGAKALMLKVTGK